MAMAEALPPDASTASTGLGLRYIGSGETQHAYAFSGEFNTTSSSQIVLEFDTGSGFIIFEAYFTGPTQFSDPNTGREANWQISLNNTVIATAHTDTSEGDIIQQPQLKFLAPPFTLIKIEVDGNDSAALMKNCCVLIGRVYEA